MSWNQENRNMHQMWRFKKKLVESNDCHDDNGQFCSGSNIDSEYPEDKYPRRIDYTQKNPTTGKYDKKIYFVKGTSDSLSLTDTQKDEVQARGIHLVPYHYQRMKSIDNKESSTCQKCGGIKEKGDKNNYGFKSNNKDFRVTKIESQVRPETVDVIRNTWNRADPKIRDIPTELQILSQDSDSTKYFYSMAKGQNDNGHITFVDRLSEKPEWYEGVTNHELGHSLWHHMNESDKQYFRKAIDQYDHAPTRYTKKFLRSDEESDSKYMETYYDELHSELTAYALGDFPSHKIEDESLMKKMMPVWKQLHPTIKQNTSLK